MIHVYYLQFIKYIYILNIHMCVCVSVCLFFQVQIYHKIVSPKQPDLPVLNKILSSLLYNMTKPAIFLNRFRYISFKKSLLEKKKKERERRKKASYWGEKGKTEKGNNYVLLFIFFFYKKFFFFLISSCFVDNFYNYSWLQ